MNKKQEINPMSSQREQAYLEILARVPARSTFACKCVCKTWLKLISDPSFIKKHLNLTVEKNKAHVMLRSHYDGCVIHTVSKDSEFDDEDDAVKLDFPDDPDKYDGVEVLGSCNGLVALSYNDENSRYDEEDLEVFRIWNPVTREYKKLPKFDNEENGVYALGFDHKIDDYKLVKVFKPPKDEDEDEDGDGDEDGDEVGDEGCCVDIYTLGTNSWKTIEQPMPYNFPFLRMPAVLVHGDFHWLGETCGEEVSKVIVSFNISDETFKAIQLPKLEGNHLLRSVGVLEDCLCVLANVENVGIEMWVMLEYGVEESWTKRHVISQESILNCKKDCLELVNDLQHFVRLVMSFKNGEILLAVPGTLVIYDPKLGSLRKSNLGESKMVILGDYFEYDNYFESLVQIGAGSYYYTEGEELAEEKDGEEEEEKEEEEGGEDEEEGEDEDEE